MQIKRSLLVKLYTVLAIFAACSPALAQYVDQSEQSRQILTYELNRAENSKEIMMTAEKMYRAFGIDEVIYYLNNNATFNSSFEAGYGDVSPKTKAILSIVMLKSTSEDRSELQKRLRFQVSLENYIQGRNKCIRLFK